ncbi:hypothetical protein ACE41H_00700 [Paenibacillus enshidis]|uniref:t-SNARE coiled-coil homology domain-containing protein n=1 Tax=Paenibacillus enshidis TaxID=1458439 RepID=A0ABV5AN96_9BACL
MNLANNQHSAFPLHYHLKLCEASQKSDVRTISDYTKEMFKGIRRFTTRLTFQSFHDKIQKKVLESLSEQILTQILDELKSLNTQVDRIDSRLDSMDSRFDGVDSRLDSMDSRFDGVDSRLDSMDSRFDGVDSRLDSMDSRFNGIDSRFDRLEADVKDIKEHTKDIPAIKQAVLENLALTKQVESAQASFERKVTSELTTHGHSIDILNRRQLKLEADVES